MIAQEITTQNNTPLVTYKSKDRYCHWLKNYLNDTQPYNEINKIDIRDILYHSLDEAKKHSSSHLEITVSIVEDAKLYSNPYYLQIIFDQILENAIIYQDPNKSEQFLDIDIAVENNMLSMNIVDNGIGISRKDKSAIFNKFYRSSNKSKGFGMGLYMSKQYINKLSGHINIDSALGVGTHCFIQIPNSFGI